MLKFSVKHKTVWMQCSFVTKSAPLATVSPECLTKEQTDKRIKIVSGKQTWCKLLTKQTWVSLAAKKTFNIDNLKILKTTMELSWPSKQNSFFCLWIKKTLTSSVSFKSRKWQKRFVHKKYIFATETKANSFHGSVIIAEKGTKVKEARKMISRKNSKKLVLEIIVVNLETTTNRNLWISNVYNSPNQDLNLINY